MSFFDEETYHALCRNDVTVREVWRLVPPNSSTRFLSLATALDGNTHVQCLSLLFTILYQGPADFFQVQEEERLRTYIQNSTSLRIVKYSVLCPPQYMGVWMDAVAANTNIISFEFHPSYRRNSRTMYPMLADALCRVLHTTQSIKDARIHLGDRIGNLSEALRSNTTLEFVAIVDCSAATIQTVIDALHGHGSICRMELGLNEAKLAEITPVLVMESLSSLLRPGSILTEISLDSFHFNEATMEQFINALDSNRSIVTLVLSTFRFSSAAVQAMLIANIQKRNEHCNDVCVPLLQADLGDGKYEDNVLRSFSAQIVMGPHSQGLTMIFTHRDRDFATFWGLLEEACASPKCLLSHLRLAYSGINVSQVESAARLVSNLPYLRTIEWDIKNEARCFLLDAFRKNGSLHSVVVNDLCERFWTPNDARLVKAWCDRNRHLPELLAQCGTKSEKEQSSTGNEDDDAAITGIPNPLKASLSSTLFAVALQTPRMALHHVFHGITAMGDDVMGVVSSQNRTFSKRIHSHDQAVAGVTGCGEEQGVPKKRRRTR